MSESAAPRITCSNLTRTYRDGDAVIVAVHDLNLQIAAGGTTAVVGPSGSGKSTLLGLLAAIEYPDSGSISLSISGQEIELEKLGPQEQSELRANHIAVLGSDHNLLPMLSVYENIALALSVQRLPEPEIDRRIRESLGRVGIESLTHRQAGGLSTGERARASFARVIATGSAVLIADEPTAHLDAENATTLARLIAEFARERRIAIVATHDPSVAAVADHVVELR